MFDTYIFDCDGTLVTGSNVIPGAIETLQQLRNIGKEVILASNSSSETVQDKIQSLNELGFTFEQKNVFTALSSTISYCQNADHKFVFVVGSEKLKQGLRDVGIYVATTNDELDCAVEAVVIGLCEITTMADIHRAQNYLQHVTNNVVVCNADEVYRSEEGIQTDVGVIAELIMGPFYMAERVIIGKPSTIMFGDILSVFPGVIPSRTIMIGDDQETDIGFGLNNNLFTVLVGTGVYDDETDYSDAHGYLASVKELFLNHNPQQCTD
jgi:HAD superfamily hydrolase (TIGR01450 family)